MKGVRGKSREDSNRSCWMVEVGGSLMSLSVHARQSRRVANCRLILQPSSYILNPPTALGRHRRHFLAYRASGI